MNPLPDQGLDLPVLPEIDPRDTLAFMADLLARRAGYVPEWLPPERGAEVAVLQVVARYLQTIAQRLNQAPYKNKLAFLDLLGIQLVPAQGARAPVVFRLSPDAADIRMPVGTRVAAAPPPGSTTQLAFETERSTGLAVARLTEVLSLWPGRDQYIDHSAALLAGQPFQPFKKLQLQNTPHILYLAHDTLLALSGKSSVDVTFELTTSGSEPLDVRWEYWDSKVWREFKAMRPTCLEEGEEPLDSTAGLTRSGRFHLETDCAKTAKTTVNGVEAFWVRGWVTQTLPQDPARVLPEVESIKFSTGIALPLAVKDLTLDKAFTDETPKGLTLDKAFTDEAAIDVTKPFYPLGLQPQPGSVFYFSNEEIFSKPGANFQMYLQTAQTPQDQVDTTNGDGQKPLLHTLSWEYWDGRTWKRLFSYTNTTASNPAPADFTGTGLINLTVPPDMARTKVNDQDGLWMRVRLMSGGFGLMQTVQFIKPTTARAARAAAEVANQFSFFVAQPPALADFRLGYTWQYGPFHPEHVFAYNDFQYEDRTTEAKWPGNRPGNPFQPFKPVSDITPALYLGFNKQLPVDDLGMYFDIVEQRGDTEGPALFWQYWDGFSWPDLVVDDETRNFRVPGLVTFIGPEDSQSLARFDTPLYWLRARLKEDGPPGEPQVNGIFPNAVWVVQQQTITDEPIGASTGQPNQVFAFRQIPVLPGELIEVRELAGLRANVEWRLVATELFKGDARILQQLEALLGSEGSQTDIEKGGLHLRRDRNKRVTEVWVRWQEQRFLFFSGPNDRHFLVDRARGRLLFGDGEHGKIPPVGAAIAARQYRTGGGLAGNVGAQTITQVLGPVGGVEKVFNPRPAEGGADAETLETLAARGPHTIRHRGRALSLQDYETLAKEASPNVAVARAIGCRDASGRQAPGWVTLVLIPQSAESRPYPSFGLRADVQKFISERAVADLAAANRIYVTGPDYVAVDVDATIVPLDPAEAGAVEKSAREAVATFLHPLRGGPAGRGWDPGRDVFLSDLASVLERVAGVNYVKELALLLNGALQAEQVKVAEDQTVVAGDIQLKFMEG